jgi:hypothetical protein
LLVFYIDAFKQNWSWNRSIVGIYMSFMNASEAEYECTKSHYLLCLMPLNVDLFDMIRKVIIAPMRLLERGYNVHFAVEGIV